ncbi:MAG: methyltransferase domain-containing protein [Acidobacteria bacterium]|nr:methyltransferase domain-containing protein [Acidobacteriota bacterium]
MLHLFRKSSSRDGSAMDGPSGPGVVSHILPRFLKRLRQIERPRLLDLGRLCGTNIEFFAQRGCKVQVEDLLLAAESAAPEGGGSVSGSDPAAAPDDSPARGGIVHATDGGPAAHGPAATGGMASPGTPMAHGPGLASPPARPGARPTRRIVLPPRTFPSRLSARPPAREAARRLAEAPPTKPRNAALPTRFDFPDETFDAIVAWDIFNFYDAAAMRLLAAEARRVLRPGGLLLGYFHARRPEGPDAPRRYRVLDEGRVACDGQAGPPLSRYVYQNRDIEKMFAGLTIVDLYFLKNATRELLMEKKAARAAGSRALIRAATPRPRFTIE